MTRGIILFGASGTGTTTLGSEIAQKINATHFDVDDYFWDNENNIPFTVKKVKEERIQLLKQDIDNSNYFVLSGNICGWDEVFVSLFDLAIFVKTSTEIRIKRLHNRELEIYGKRILKGGDMYHNHIEFLKWAGEYDTEIPPKRCQKLHEEWIKTLSCRTIMLDGSAKINENIELIITVLKEIKI